MENLPKELLYLSKRIMDTYHELRNLKQEEPDTIPDKIANDMKVYEVESRLFELKEVLKRFPREQSMQASKYIDMNI